MTVSRLALVAILAAAQPLVALAQATPPPDKKDPPLLYGPKLHDPAQEEAAAMRAVAERNKKAWQASPATRKLAPRRPTRQDVIAMPPSPASTSGYVPMPVPAPAAGVTPIVPSPPAPVDCIGASCVRAGGLPLPPPVGSTTIDANGRQCVQNGNFVQCF